VFDQAVGRAFVVAAKDVAKEVSTRAKAVRAVQLSSAIALKAFTSLLPLLLAIVGIIGFISAGDSTIGNRMVDRLGLTGDLERVFRDNLATATSSRGIAGTIGLLGSLWTGLAVIKAIATACDAVWQVPERGIIDRLIGVPWFIGALIISVLSGLATAIVQFMPIPFVGGVVAWLASSVTGGALVWWTHRIMTNVRIPNTSHVPGAIVAGAALALFQVLGASIVPRLLASASQTYALLASVFVMLTLLTMLGNVIVYGAIINVVLWEHRHGTTTMVALVPALPSDPYVQLGRGGQRPRPPKRPGLPKRLKR
jgi:uncharacterized BrkB/YihY/UPF0761 family membrane protein